MRDHSFIVPLATLTLLFSPVLGDPPDDTNEDNIEGLLEESDDATMIGKLIDWMGVECDVFADSNLALVSKWIAEVERREVWGDVCVYGWGSMDACVEETERERKRFKETAAAATTPPESPRSRSASDTADFLSSSPRSPQPSR